jgi:ribonuclease HI
MTVHLTFYTSVGGADSRLERSLVMAAKAARPVVIYTDGACSGNPGLGGWGAVLIYGRHKKELWGGEAASTNNRMELLGAISALEALTRPSKVELWTDSSYVKDGITKWIHGWKRNGWRTAARKPVKNAELWQRLDAAQVRHEITWHWLKGHAGHEFNERADALARAGIKDLKAAAARG